MKRMAVFGGTFNPIHNGHIYLIRAFADRLQTDEVLTVVTNVPPHKISVDLADRDRTVLYRSLDVISKALDTIASHPKAQKNGTNA